MLPAGGELKVWMMSMYIAAEILVNVLELGGEEIWAMPEKKSKKFWNSEDKSQEVKVVQI